MKRKLTAIALVTVLICMVLTNTIACSPGLEPTRYTLWMVPRDGGKIVYDYVWLGVEHSRDCQPGGVCSLNMPEGNVVVLTAVPDEGFVFVNWTDDVDTIADAHDDTITITMSRDYVLVANFLKQVRDWHDLDSIRDNLGADYILINDLDSTTAGYEELAGAAANDGKGWQPIGDLFDEVSEPFRGTFDGQGYEISNLFIYRPEEHGIGLFGAVSSRGIIENVRMVNVDVTGLGMQVARGVGSLVGDNYGTVRNCYSGGTVTGEALVGGLVGYSFEGTVNNSYSAASVSGGDSVGGLVGYSQDATVSNSYASGNVTGDYRVGGLVGAGWGGTVSNSYASGDVTGDRWVGGLLGGFRYGTTVSNSYASGNVTGYMHVGGLVGDSFNATISSSYASGNVTGTLDVGGLVGSEEGGTVSNSFWDTETSGQDTSAGGTGKTTAEIQDITTFTDTATEGLGEPWEMIAVANPNTRNSDYIWNIVDGQTYPFLRWQPVT